MKRPAIAVSGAQVMPLAHPPTVSAWIHRLARECGEREMIVLGDRRLT